MKTLEDYMKISYHAEIVEDKDEGGFVASYVELPGCITCGDTMEIALSNLEDAKREWLVAAFEEGLLIDEKAFIKKIDQNM